MPGFQGPDVVLQLAKSAVDDLALRRLRFLTERVGRAQTTNIAGAECHLRWVRPSLTFPADAPDQVRLGLAIEGGVRLLSGRMLSVDAFVTVTQPPRLTRDDSGWYARLTLEHLDIGAIQLTYAGQALASDEPGMPTGAELAQLRDDLQAAIEQLCQTLPDLPLTPAIHIEHPTPVIYAYIWPDTQGAALALSIHPNAEGANGALPLRVTQRATAALLLNSTPFAAAFADLAATSVLPLPDAFTDASVTVALDDAQLQCTVRALATTGEAAAPLTVQFNARPAWEGDALALDVLRITADDPAQPTTERLLIAVQSVAFLDTLAQIAQTALEQAAKDYFHPDHQADRALPDESDALRPSAIQVGAGYISLAGNFPTTPEATEPVVDGPSFDLRLTDLVQASDADQPLSLTVSVVNQQHVEPPVDYAWWTSLATEMREEHGAILDIRVAADGALDDTQPRQTRALPQGVVAAQAAIIDAFGRVARAVLEIDLRGDMTAQLDRYATADTVPTPSDSELLVAANTRLLNDVGEEITGTGTQQAYSRMGTRLNATTYRPTMVLPLPHSPGQSSLLGMFAGALAMFAIFAAIAALVLSRTLNPATAITPTPSPTVSAIATATLGITPTATVTTPGPTFTPQPFGRFDTAPQSLQFDCSTPVPPPAPTPTPTPAPIASQTVLLTNTGTETVKWTAQPVGWPQATWVAISPAIGTLKPSASTTLTIAPNANICGIPTGTFLGIQFNATGVLPLTVQVTHT